MKKQGLVKGQFNASITCSAMENVCKSQAGPVFQELKDCYTQALKLHSMEWTDNAGQVMGMADVFRTLWAELSKDVH
eukprot:1470068-Rhodomonas_salina.2